MLLYELLLSPGKSIKPPPLPPGMEDEEQKKKKKQSDVTTTTLTSAEKLIVSKTGELKNQLALILKKANAQTALEFV